MHVDRLAGLGLAMNQAACRSHAVAVLAARRLPAPSLWPPGLPFVKEQRMASLAPEWLWRLQQIEDHLERVFPSDQTFVAYALREEASAQEKPPEQWPAMATWPKGRCLSCSRLPYLLHGLWGGRHEVGFSLHRDRSRSHMIWWRGDDVGYGGTTPGKPEAASFELYTFTYITKKKIPAGPSPIAVETGLAEVEVALMDLLDEPPSPVSSALGKCPPVHYWSDALLWLAAKREHPFLQAWGVEPTARRNWGGFMPDALIIYLTPDVRAATKYAIEVLKKAFGSAAADEASTPEDLITMVVAVRDFQVSRSTIRRHVKQGKIHDYRELGHKDNATLILSRAECANNYARRK
jgi:hypothetical protein